MEGPTLARMRSSVWLSCGLLASGLVRAQQPAQYAVTLVERSPLPTISAANARGHGHCPVRPADKAPCQCFNPSYIPASAHKLNQSGVLLRICCGYKSCDYLCRRQDKAIPPSACAAPPSALDSGGPNFPRDDEYIGFAPCDITTGKCGDVLPRSSFSLDPSQGTLQDPRCTSQNKWHRNCASHRIDTCLSLQRSISTPRWRESIPHTQGIRGRMPCVYRGIVIKGQRILLHLLPITRQVWVELLSLV